jgi:hypothetical protein
VGVEFGDDAGDVVIMVANDLPIVERRRPEPPLRPWAPTRTLRMDPGRLDDLLDIAPALEAPEQRRLVTRGLRAGTAAARRRALDVLCDLDGPEAARRRARWDGNEQVRTWRPPTAETVFASPRA